MSTNKSVKMTALGVALLLGVIVLMAPTGCSNTLGIDADGNFLMVDSVTQSSRAQPAFEISNVGVRKSYVMAMGFVLRADETSTQEITVDVPAGCHSMYEDMLEERILRVVCHEGLEINGDDSLMVNITLGGPWDRVDLITLVAEDEYGYKLMNSLSADFDGPFWTNPTP